MVHATTSFLALVALVASHALAAPQVAKRFVDYSVHEERTHLPAHWTRAESAAVPDKRSEGIILPVRINLAQNNVERAHDILMDISDPESPRYSEHLSPHEVAELVSLVLLVSSTACMADQVVLSFLTGTSPKMPLSWL